MQPVTYFDRITFDQNVLNGSATIKGTTFLASKILELMAEGLSKDEIIKQHPFLEQEDITATLNVAIKLLK